MSLDRRCDDGADEQLPSKPDPGPATLVNLGAIKVSGKAHAGIGNTTPTPVNFSYPDIQAMTKKTVTTTNFTQSLTGSLLGDLALNVQVGPLGLPIPGLGDLVTGIMKRHRFERQTAGLSAGDAWDRRRAGRRRGHRRALRPCRAGELSALLRSLLRQIERRVAASCPLASRLVPRAHGR